MTARSVRFARAFRFPTLAVGLFAFFVALFCAAWPLLQDPDIWWHLRNASALLAGHRFVRADSFTFTAHGMPWVDPEWLSELPYWIAWRLFRYRGIECWTLATLLGMVLGLCFLCWQRTRSLRSSILGGVLFLPLVAVSMGPRMLISGWLCLIVELALLWEFRQRRDRLWGLPALFCIWINAHGSWLFGMALLAVFVAAGWRGETQGSVLVVRWTTAQQQKLLRVLGASVAALFVNPYGWRLVAYPFQILNHPLTLEHVEEWQTLNFHIFRGRYVLLLLVLLVVMNMARRRMWLLQDVAFVSIAVLAGFSYTRMVVATGIVVLPLLAREVGMRGRGPETVARDRPWLNFALLVLASLFLVTHVPSQAGLQTQVAARYPEKALQWMQSAKLQGRVLNDFTWGGYLGWNDPASLYFIDTRADVFEQTGVFEAYLDATKMVRPLAVLDAYHIQYVLFPPNAEIVYLLRHTAGWHVRYEDGVAVLLERDRTSVTTPPADSRSVAPRDAASSTTAAAASTVSSGSMLRR